MFRPGYRSIYAAKRSLTQQGKRFYSDHHEHLAPAANLWESYMVTPLLLTTGVIAVFWADSSYRKSHNGKSMFTSFDQPLSVDSLKANFASYQEAVLDERKLYELISFTPKFDKDHYPLAINEVPGKYFPYNAASNFGASVDFNNLEERKKEADFYK